MLNSLWIKFEKISCFAYEGSPYSFYLPLSENCYNFRAISVPNLRARKIKMIMYSTAQIFACTFKNNNSQKIHLHRMWLFNQYFLNLIKDKQSIHIWWDLVKLARNKIENWGRKAMHQDQSINNLLNFGSKYF